MIRVGDYIATEKDKQSIMEVLNSNRLTEWKKVAEFEQLWADYIGTKYCVLTNSGTSALILSLYTIKTLESEIKTVLTSPLTFIATVNAIMLSGLMPDFVDVDLETFGILPELANKKEADIFLPVHLYGFPVDLDKITKFKYVIEDACQAHGSIYNGRKVGSIGTMGCFSFYIAHNIQVGDMGAITTNDKEIYRFLKKAKAHGRICECPICQRQIGECPHKGKDFDPRFTFDTIAYNFKTSEFNAALGINQIKLIDEIVKRRNDNVFYFNSELAKFGDILQLPKWDINVSYLAYPIIVKDTKRINRNKLRILLEEKGIETRPLFSCVPNQQPAYSFLKGQWDLPNADWLGANGLHCGIHQYLTQEDLDKIVKVFKEILE